MAALDRLTTAVTPGAAVASAAPRLAFVVNLGGRNRRKFVKVAYVHEVRSACHHRADTAEAWQGVSVVTRDQLPSYQELMYPTLRAVEELGGSAQGREITTQVIADIGATDEQLEITYDKRPKSVLVDRIDWARAICDPRRPAGTTTAWPVRPHRVGWQVLAKPEDEAREALRGVDRELRANRRATTTATVAPDPESQLADEALLADDDAEVPAWRDVLLGRLHRLSPNGFEEFVIYLLKTFGMELTRVGSSGDEGIDGIGLAPLSPVLSTRVAVQVKRYDPGSAIGREVVALFQRDASTAGAERAILVTLGRFTAAARKAAIVSGRRWISSTVTDSAISSNSKISGCGR